MNKLDNIKKLLGLIHDQEDFNREYSKHFRIPPLQISSTSIKQQDETIVFLQNFVRNQKLNLKKPLNMSETPQVNKTPQTYGAVTLEKLEMIAECITGDLDRWNLNETQKLYVLDLVQHETAQKIIKNKEKYPKIIVQKAQQRIK